MISEKIKKVLSATLLGAYLMVFGAPAGFCLATPAISAQINKPVLRASKEPSALKLEGDISISKGNPKINLSLRDSDVQQVLRMFADKAGLNIIFHESATGKVTLDLVNMPLNEAFKLVLQITNLTYYIDNNTMVVMSATAAQSLNLSKQELTTIPVRYVNAATLATFLNQNIFSINKPGLSNAQVAVTNPANNEILIFGTKNDYLMAKKIVEQFDVKPREETFVVNHTTPKEMADLLCNVLFKNMGSSGGSSGGGTGGGSAPAAPAKPSSSGSPTGGAASTGGSSGGGSSSGISLGAGTVACQFQASVSAGSLASVASQNMSITYFPQRGVISVFGGSAQQIDMIKEFISENDKKQPQAYLELSIIELSESGSKEFSNTWQVWSSFFSGSFAGSGTSTNQLYPTFMAGDSYSALKTAEGSAPEFLYNVARYASKPTITYAINYVIENSKGRVLANPRIMITNGQTSTIDLSSDYVKTVKSEILTNSLVGGVQRTYEVGSDEGIKVEMVPFISPEGYVTMNIKPEYATIKEQVFVPTEVNGKTYNDLVATLLQRRNLDLKNVRIKDGETLVIGGMMREVETKGISKIPVLGDLPGVGMFFRNSSTKKEKQELVIMMTPKIIKDTEDMVRNSAGDTL